MDSLYAQLGGEAGVDQIVALLYQHVLDDETLAPYFDGIEMPAQQRKFLHFLHLATDGHHNYSGVDLRAAHVDVVEQGVTGDHIDRLLLHLQEALGDVGTAPETIEQVMERVRSYSGYVLGE